MLFFDKITLSNDRKHLLAVLVVIKDFFFPGSVFLFCSVFNPY